MEDAVTRPAFAAVAAGLILAASALMSRPASAVDQTMRGWQGAYVGANLGYQWSGVRGTPANPSGVTGGVQLGHNWQFGQYVFGGEADIQLSDADDKFAAWKFSNPWFGT